MSRTRRRIDILEIYNLHLDHAPSVHLPTLWWVRVQVDKFMLKQNRIQRMKKLIIASILIFTSSSVFADIKFIENKTVLGQLLIMDAFNRIENGKGILKTPVANLESTITPSFITNPNKRCWMSPQYHSDGSVTPRLKCH